MEVRLRETNREDSTSKAKRASSLLFITVLDTHDHLSGL